MEYPELPEGVSASARPTTSRSWSTRPTSRRRGATTCAGKDVECTDVFDRGAFRSIYLRDPDGHVVEIATRGPGFGAGAPRLV